MNNRNYRQENQTKGGGGYFKWTIVMIFGVIALVFGVVRSMDQKRQITAIDKEIALLEKKVEELRPVIKNKQIYLESLKNSKVVEFARRMKMVSPGPGQICVVDEQDMVNADLLIAGRDGTGMNGGESTVASRRN